MNTAPYSALIRTFNSEATLARTLESLRRQTIPPYEYIFVDSGSTDNTLSNLPANSIVHRDVGTEFNFSESLNQGLHYVSTDYVLIISSHTSLLNNSAIDFALEIMNAGGGIGAAYFTHADRVPLQYRVIQRQNFNGFNGLWNTCSFIKMSYLKQRAFRPEVFSAEDQEWASWLFRERNGSIARISGAGMETSNPRHGSFKKRLNEHIAIAYYAHAQLLKWPHIARIAFRVIKPSLHTTLNERLFNFILFFRLIECHIRKPSGRSRYF